MSYREGEIACPACRHRIEWRQVGERHVARCAACMGVWMETGQFLALLREAQPEKAPDELMVHNDGSPRRDCPVCAAPMDLAWLDFLCLDQCLAHGVFLDAGELEKALEWEVSRKVIGARPKPRNEKNDANDAAVIILLSTIR